MRILILALVSTASVSGIFFPSAGGGGGCGGGCGCEDTSCIPRPPQFRLACQRISFSIPTLKIIPPPPPCGCGCGGRKKREASGDATCTVPELKELIDKSIRNSPKESRNNIVKELKEKYATTRYLVTCVFGETEFETSADNFCKAGTKEQTCFVVQAEDDK